MYRIPLRNNNVTKNVNQRVMDAVFMDDGSIWLETKDRGAFKQINLADVLKQIEAAEKQNITQSTTEPLIR